MALQWSNGAPCKTSRWSRRRLNSASVAGLCDSALPGNVRMLRPALLACTTLLALAACERVTAPETATAETSETSAKTAETGRKFFGREAFTIVMQQTGREEGTLTLHYRDWGRRSAEIAKLTNTETGEVIDTRSFTDGAVNVTIDNLTGKVQVFENPYYHPTADDEPSTPDDGFGAAAMERLGGEKTGESASIAGQTCDYWNALGAKMCVAPWGATLHSTMGIGDTVADRKAVEVRLGDGGPDSAFVYVPPADGAASAPAPATAPATSQ